MLMHLSILRVNVFLFFFVFVFVLVFVYVGKALDKHQHPLRNITLKYTTYYQRNATNYQKDTTNVI